MKKVNVASHEYNEEEKDEFWKRNPKGIYLPALFGENHGQGEVGQRIRKLDTNGDGYIQRTSMFVVGYGIWRWVVFKRREDKLELGSCTVFAHLTSHTTLLQATSFARA